MSSLSQVYLVSLSFTYCTIARRRRDWLYCCFGKESKCREATPTMFFLDAFFTCRLYKLINVPFHSLSNPSGWLLSISDEVSGDPFWHCWSAFPILSMNFPGMNPARKPFVRHQQRLQNLMWSVFLHLLKILRWVTEGIWMYIIVSRSQSHSITKL